MLEVLPEVETEVQEFLSSQPVKMFVGGEWTDSQSGKTFATRDPGEGLSTLGTRSADLMRFPCFETCPSLHGYFPS